MSATAGVGILNQMKIRLRDRILWGLFTASAGRAYPTGRLFLWTPVNYSRKKYRSLVARMSRLNLIQSVLIEGRVNFRLTELGRKQLFKSFPVLMPQLTKRIWNGFWRMIIFDIPEGKRKQRDNLRHRLIKLGFGRLQDSIYLSPYDWDESLFNGALLLEAKQKHLGDPKKLAAQIWPLDQINTQYKQVIDRLTTRFGIKEETKRDEFLKKIYRDYLEALLIDSFLPPELLPIDWLAEKAKKYVLRAGEIKE